MASSSPATTSTGNPYRLNSQEYDSRLTENASRLFSTNAVRVIHCDGGYRFDLDKETAIREYLQSHEDFSGTRIIIIPQEHSWGELLISELGLRALFAGLGVFEEFHELVHAFGAKTVPVDETYVSRPMLQQDEAGSFQLCYLAKSVELNTRGPEEELDQYSVCQMAVYHNYNAPRKANTFILVNPSITFQLHWKQAQVQHPMGWMDMHVAVAYAMNCRWREYINFLETNFDKFIDDRLGGQGHHFSLLMGGTRRNTARIPTDSVDAGDEAAAAPAAPRPNTPVGEAISIAQSLRNYKARVLLLDHVLRLSTSVLHDLQGVLVLLVPTPAARPGARDDEVRNIFSRYLSETQISSLRTEHLLKRMDDASALQRTITDVGAFKRASEDKEIMVELSRQAREDSKIMVMLLRMITLLRAVTPLDELHKTADEGWTPNGRVRERNVDLWLTHHHLSCPLAGLQEVL